MYSRKAHGTTLAYIARHLYFRVLMVTYAFLVFLGVMPKPPARMPYQSALEHMILTVTTPLTGFMTLAVILALIGVISAGIAAAFGLKPPPEPVPDESADGGPL